jgi:AcrR family transcriptional regulator
MTDLGLRQRKKRATRRLIADTAAALFAQHGYEHVAVVDVATAANVSEQTVYNYFPTKERLVLDREDELLERLPRLIRTRARGTSPAAALRDEALAFVDGIASIPSEQARGGLGYLATISPTVRRLCLEMTDRLAGAIADAIAEPAKGPPGHLAKLEAVALAWVFQTITDETGRRELAGHDPSRTVDELRPIVVDLIDSLDRWTSHT